MTRTIFFFARDNLKDCLIVEEEEEDDDDDEEKKVLFNMEQFGRTATKGLNM